MPMIRVPIADQSLTPAIGRNLVPPVERDGCLFYEVTQTLEAYWSGLTPAVQWELVMRADKHSLDLRRVLNFYAGNDGS